MSGGVVFMGGMTSDNIREVADAADLGEVSHAVVAYRKTNGDLCYRTLDDNNLTYLVGMMSRVQMALHDECRTEAQS